jgi:hypothetical protein
MGYAAAFVGVVSGDQLFLLWQGRMMLTFSRDQDADGGTFSVRLAGFQMQLTRQVSG